MKRDICVQFLCKDCEDFCRCQYYHSRKEDSYICKYFHLPDKLDKIRAEVESLTIKEGSDDYTRKMAELYSLKIKVLQIIDKYKAESEDV